MDQTKTIDIQEINTVFLSADEHMGEKTSDTDGAHGIRYNETTKTLEVLTSEGVWITLK